MDILFCDSISDAIHRYGAFNSQRLLKARQLPGVCQESAAVIKQLPLPPLETDPPAEATPLINCRRVTFMSGNLLI